MRSIIILLLILIFTQDLLPDFNFKSEVNNSINKSIIFNFLEPSKIYISEIIYENGEEWLKTTYNFVLDNKKNIIGETIHYEEGARFWKKPNKNVIINVDYKKSLEIKNPDFIWLNFSQIKKLNFKKGVLNPFVKTILFII